MNSKFYANVSIFARRLVNVKSVAECLVCGAKFIVRGHATKWVPKQRQHSAELIDHIIRCVRHSLT